jgi:hypothetical protein
LTKVPGSWWTTWRFIKQCPKVEYIKEQWKPAWTERHLKARLGLAISHVTWTIEWDTILFCDEKKWNLDGRDGCQYYWHDLQDEPRWFKRRIQGGGSVMTWAGFGVNGKTTLKVVHGRMASEDYQELLANSLLPVGADIGGSGWIIQQNNAPIHVFRSTLDWFRRNGIRILV